MQSIIDKGLARYRFDSLYEVSQYIDREPRTWGRIEHSRSNRATNSWDLGLGYDGAVKLARDGWIEGAERAQEALRAFQPRNPSPDTRVDFYGHMPHVPRYCAGAPDSMMRHTTPPKIGSGRILVLYVNIAANCNQKATNMANFGLGVSQYINQLESEGLRVELHAIMSLDAWIGNVKRGAWAIKLKDADQPLDLAVVAFAIGHPAMFRRIWFALQERGAMKPSSGYHMSVNAKPSDIIDMPPNAYILNGMVSANTNAPTPEKALEHIESQINKAIELAEREY